MIGYRRIGNIYEEIENIVYMLSKESILLNSLSHQKFPACTCCCMYAVIFKTNPI